MTHERYMERCLQLAKRGLGSVSTNPMVGAVLVHNDRILAEGYHQQFGGPHAEVNCLDAVAEEDRKFITEATLYVSLEPCSHQGKTPPCALRIIKDKVANVVVAMDDVNPKVAGRGIRMLKEAGIAVTQHICTKEAEWLNRRFITAHRKKRPYIIVKFAQSSDGFMATKEGKPHWFTGGESRVLVHRWRSEEDAIMVGAGTLLSDNPKLNTRFWPGTSPQIVIVDKEGAVQQLKEARVWESEKPPLVFTTAKPFAWNHAQVIQLSKERFLPQVFQSLWQDFSLQSVLVEGGPQLLRSLREGNLWDEARVLTGAAPLLQGVKSPTFKGQTLEQTSIAEDILHITINTAP